LLRYVPYLDVTSVTTFTDPYTAVSYSLYPNISDGLFNLMWQALLLRCGPHQFQILGLYVGLFGLITPIAFFFLSRKKVFLLLGMSWGIYWINFLYPESAHSVAEIRPTGAQFEFAFPLLAWQLVYIHGMVLGYHKQRVVDYFTSYQGRVMIYVAMFLALCFVAFSMNHPISEFPSWAKFSFVSPDVFNEIYFNYFQKYKLGPGRLFNLAVWVVATYALLSRFWLPFERLLGWFLIPLGQASLYVFFVHVFIIIGVNNSPFPGYQGFWVNTGLHVGTLLLVWGMIKVKFLFRWIPQ
jgi:hypothetical protein